MASHEEPVAETGRNFDPSEDSDVIRVEARNLGWSWIIDSEGADIKKMESESGAEIRVSKDRDSTSVDVFIRGTPEAKSAAREMIKNCVNNLKSNNDYNQSRSGGYNSSGRCDTDYQPLDWKPLCELAEKQAAAKLASLPPIVKNLYQEDPQVANMSRQEVANFRANHMKIKVERVLGDEKKRKKPILNPVRTFEQAFRPYPEILKMACEQNLTKPRPIQSQAWPIILSGEDFIGIAQTGTGKTLAFLLPALIHIESQVVLRNQRAGPTVLILSPARELALQIEKEINKYSYRGIKCVCVYEGDARREQDNILAQKPEIVVATPGRLEDFISTDQILLESVTYVVLDEADKMMIMGFECAITRILSKVRGDRQSIITSATWLDGVRKLVSRYSNNPVRVIVASLDLTAVHSASQRIGRTGRADMAESDCINILLRYKEDPQKRITLFGLSKFITHYYLMKEGFKSTRNFKEEEINRLLELDNIKEELYELPTLPQFQYKTIFHSSSEFICITLARSTKGKSDLRGEVIPLSEFPSLIAENKNNDLNILQNIFCQMDSTFSKLWISLNSNSTNSSNSSPERLEEEMECEITEQNLISFIGPYGEVGCPYRPTHVPYQDDERHQSI